MPDLSIIIVSYNSAAWLPPCLTSVFAHAGGAELEMIVVDNASSDGSAELVERDFPGVRVVRSANLGFAYGNNRGFEHVSSPFVLFLNPDTRIVDGTFGELLEMMRSRPTVGLAGCRQVSPEGVLQPTIRRFPTASRAFFEALGSERFPFRASWLGERELSEEAYSRETPCDWTSGSFMLARTDAVVRAGLMDERYFMYCEEPDLCLRLKRQGFETHHLPEMTIVHHAGKAGWNERLVAQEAHARRQYAMKNLSRVDGRLTVSAMAFGHVLRSAYPTRDLEQRLARRRCARAALTAALGRGTPPFAPAGR